VWTFAVVLLAPECHGASYISKGTEPVRVPALAAQRPGEALDMLFCFRINKMQLLPM
jgi:hypothetical protein